MITMQELQEKVGGVFYFATVEDGEPRVRPFGFTMVFEDKLYFGAGTHKAAYAQLMKDPHLEVCALRMAALCCTAAKPLWMTGTRCKRPCTKVLPS